MNFYKIAFAIKDFEKTIGDVEVLIKYSQEHEDEYPKFLFSSAKFRVFNPFLDMWHEFQIPRLSDKQKDKFIERIEKYWEGSF